MPVLEHAPVVKYNPNHEPAGSPEGGQFASGDGGGGDTGRLFADAVRYFGETDDPESAGFVLPDGRMLDFSTKEHNRISELPGLNDFMADGEHSHVDAFIRLGGMRWMFMGAERGIAVQIIAEPTEKQYQRMVRSARDLKVVLLIEIDNELGVQIAAQDFDRPTLQSVKEFWAEHHPKPKAHAPVTKAVPVPNVPDSLLRVADLLEPQMASAFLNTIIAARASLDLGDLAQALIDGDLTAAEIAVGLSSVEDALDERLPEVVRRAFFTAAEVVAEILEEELQVGLRFDVVNEEAVDYAERQVGNRITEVTKDTVDAIRDIIRQSVGGEVGQVEPVVREIRDVIGLRRDQMAAVREYRDGLVADGTERVAAEVKATKYAHELLKERALLIARTEIMDALNAGAVASWRQAMAAGWIDAADMKVEWIATPDERLCPICAELEEHDNVLFGEPFYSEELGEDVLRPPAHPACLPGETHVAPGGAVTAQTERWYEGKLVILVTASGNRLTCTPNHPILTPHGWKAAGLLREGDHVVRSLQAEWTPSIHDDDEHMPARIEEIARAFRHAGEVTTAEVPVAAEDFHGDGAGSKVAVIRSNRLLRDRLKAASREQPPEAALGRGHARHLLHRGSHATALLDGPVLPAGRQVRGANLPTSLSRRHLGPLHKLSGGAASDQNAAGDETPGQHGPTEAALVGELLHGCAGPVAPDQLTEVRDVEFSGHVYNLETEGGWYIANGIITHNCRCTLTLLPLTAAEIEAARELPQAAGAHLPVVKGYPEFNPDQERDEGGRWGPGGGSGGSDVHPSPAPGRATWEWTTEEKQRWVEHAAKEAGVHPGRVKLVNENVQYTIGDTNISGRTAAEAHWDTGEIWIRPPFWLAQEHELRPMFAHEALHLRYAMVSTSLKAERERLMEHERSVPRDSLDSDLAHTLMNGDIKPEYRHLYPLGNGLEPHLAIENLDAIVTDAQGLSKYAGDWSNAWKDGQAHTDNFLTEVISEVAAAKAQGKAYYMAKTTKRLRDLYRAWNEAYEYGLAPKAS